MSIENKRVIYPTDDGGVAVVTPAPGVELEVVLKAVPVGKPYQIIDAAEVTADRSFRAAWEVDANRKSINVNIDKAKDVAHGIRRAVRNDELAPFDEAIAKRIPGVGVPDELENARQKIREKYAVVQDLINEAVSVEQIKAAIEGLV